MNKLWTNYTAVCVWCRISIHNGYKTFIHVSLLENPPLILEQWTNNFSCRNLAGCCNIFTTCLAIWITRWAGCLSPLFHFRLKHLNKDLKDCNYVLHSRFPKGCNCFHLVPPSTFSLGNTLIKLITNLLRRSIAIELFHVLAGFEVIYNDSTLQSLVKKIA